MGGEESRQGEICMWYQERICTFLHATRTQHVQRYHSQNVQPFAIIRADALLLISWKVIVLQP